MNNIKIRTMVFCENIRTEVGGKHTLLGAAAPELNISQIPATIPIAIWISGVSAAAGPFVAEIRVLDPDKKAILTGKLEGEIAGTGESSLALGPLPLRISKAGDYLFEWNFDGKNWDKIGMLRMNYIVPNVAVTAPTASMPPSSQSPSAASQS